MWWYNKYRSWLDVFLAHRTKVLVALYSNNYGFGRSHAPLYYEKYPENKNYSLLLKDYVEKRVRLKFATPNLFCIDLLPIGLCCIWRQHGVQQPLDHRKLVPSCRNSLNKQLCPMYITFLRTWWELWWWWQWRSLLSRHQQLFLQMSLVVSSS